MLVIFEMANNHQGDLKHGVRLIKKFARVSEPYRDKFTFAFKFQYRDLDSFIHPDFKGGDLKYVKRFEETRLAPAAWQELIKAVKEEGMLAICTPFDEASVPKIVDHGFDVLKIASCSLLDWPLLEQIASHDIPLIASVGGSNDEDISNVNAFLSHRDKEYAMLYCVGLYPTEDSNHNIAMIGELISRYPKVTFGFSTHEHPNETMAGAIAMGAGAKIFEKHVALPTDEYKKNLYSVDVEECKKWLDGLEHAQDLLGTVEDRSRVLEVEQQSLRPLMRGVFARRDIHEGETISKDNCFLAIPSGSEGLVANDLSKFKKYTAVQAIKQNELIENLAVNVEDNRAKIVEIRNRIRRIIDKNGIVIPRNVKLEISYHYGLEKFDTYGLCMITVLNKQYCKKLLFLLPGQQHPEQYHNIKHETFIILSGDIHLKLDDKESTMEAGDLVSIVPGVRHAFWSENGCIIEELSTEHIKDDSFYTDDAINTAVKRKSYIELL